MEKDELFGGHYCWSWTAFVMRHHIDPDLKRCFLYIKASIQKPATRNHWYCESRSLTITYTLCTKSGIFTFISIVLNRTDISFPFDLKLLFKTLKITYIQNVLYKNDPEWIICMIYEWKIKSFKYNMYKTGNNVYGKRVL